jgi:hypothetical protein
MTGRDVLLDPGGEKAALQDWILGVLYLCLDVLSWEVFRSEPDNPDLVFRLEVLMGVRMSAIDPMPVVHDGRIVVNQSPGEVIVIDGNLEVVYLLTANKFYAIYLITHKTYRRVECRRVN